MERYTEPKHFITRGNKQRLRTSILHIHGKKVAKEAIVCKEESQKSGETMKVGVNRPYS